MSSTRLKIDPSLARGSDYYTGPVFELRVDEPKVGSLGGGGRYDKLIGMFSGRDVPAVGFSFGLERIILVLEELNMLELNETSAAVMVSVFSDDTKSASADFATRLRANAIPTELYLGSGKLKSQFKYANARGYPYLAVIGEAEKADKTVTIKNLQTGEQTTISQSEAIAYLQSNA